MDLITLSTNTNDLPEEWAINDEVVRLREWGTDRAHPLFSDARGPLTVGSMPTCSIPIDDKTHRVSRKHAVLQRVQGKWGVLDQSKNGLYRDGAKLEKFVVTPGMMIGLGGGVTLVAESARLITLRSALSRMLGWGAASLVAVDLALRAIRFAARRLGPLVLCGDDLVPLAEELHRLTLTAVRPFVSCNPRRSTSESAWDPTRCAQSGLAALEAASKGTVCLVTKRLPSDWKSLIHAIHRPECQTQLVVCSEGSQDAELFNTAPIIIPSLASRKEEIERIIDEYAADAAGELRMGEYWLSPTERAWIRSRMPTLAAIQNATLRLAAIQQAGSIPAGATLLNISHQGMYKWLDTHGYPRAAGRWSPAGP
ncbi:MAG TPA: FHA domain-containing protein [Kofleriaceae bacterium]|nr:FHA domain-containing protein [Kofleriaceae bacterium]